MPWYRLLMLRRGELCISAMLKNPSPERQKLYLHGINFSCLDEPNNAPLQCENKKPRWIKTYTSTIPITYAQMSQTIYIYGAKTQSLDRQKLVGMRY